MPRHLFWLAALGLTLAASARAQTLTGNPTPRIDSVVPLALQPHATAKSTIWYDDFNGPEKTYTETAGEVDRTASLGGAGGSMLCLAFGAPLARIVCVDPFEPYDELTAADRVNQLGSRPRRQL